MDSSETTAKTNAEAFTSFSATATATANTTISSSSSPAVQESPFTNYASNLSPIETVRGSHGLQGTLGLNSPPLVFTTPHTNAPRETVFLKRLDRLPFHQLPSPEMSQNDDGGRKFADGPGDLEKSDLSLHGGLVIDTRKDNDMRSSLQVQPSSSSGCVDEYLTDPVDVDCANSACVDINLKQSSAVLQSSLSGRNDSKKTLTKFDNKNDRESKVDITVDIFGEAEENIHGKSTCGIKTNKNEENKTHGVCPRNECSKIESHLSFDHASKKQQSENSSVQNVGSASGGESDRYQQLLSESWQTLQTYEDSRDNSRQDPEVSKQQRGMSRRCLQFAEAQPKATVDSSNPSNKTNDAINSRSPAEPVEPESLASSYVDLNAASGKKRLANLAQPVTPMFPPRHTGKSPLTVSKPSGIGLHLNSIVNALPKGQGATFGVKLARVEHEMLENKASIATSSFISESFDDPVSLNWLPLVDHNATPTTKRNFNSEQIDSFEEFSQLSPKKKRKKSSSSLDGDGCKRCNCKKTKCLKLYCDCFAAGIYCAESCACQGCFNRPEYEDTVLETRQQIESRNPLAFASKIIKQDDGNHFTPSSARHKRGCNCKKSMCLKKYCECYQANVGCSSGCRCEGCKNVYGKKEEYVGNEELLSNRAISEGTSDAKLEMVTNKRDFLHAEFYDPNNLTPLTPAFQCSDHGKDASNSQILPSRYVPAPESDLAILSSCGKSHRSLKNSESNEMLQDTSKAILDVDSYGQGRDYNSMDMVEQFSSRSLSLADLCDSPPVPDFPSMAMVSSASSNTTDWTNASKLQLYPRSGNLSLGGSLRWRSSPITPMTQLGGTKSLQALGCDSRLSGIVEDDTPKILKDTSTPIKSVKVSSPSCKRVSPPHGCANELWSSSSGALKNGRKFILKAVPSFPPLSPCIDSKESPDREKSNVQVNKQ